MKIKKLKSFNISGEQKLKITALVLTLVLLVVSAFASLNNKVISYEENIAKAQANICAQEKRKVDLIPTLVECVKSYDKYEYETLMYSVLSRKSDSNIGGVQSMISAVAEAYPELASDDNYRRLMTELTDIETNLLNCRNTYNALVSEYNEYVRQFPNAQTLKLIGYETIEYTYLTYENEEKVSLNLFKEETTKTDDKNKK